MTDVANLVKKRGSIKATVTNIKKFTDRVAADQEAGQAVNKEQIETRLEKLREAWIEFHEVENLLSLHPGQILESEDFEDKYFDTMAALRHMLNSRTSSIAPQASTSNNISVGRGAYDGDRSAYLGADIRLPRVAIEPFYGDYSKWQSFQDQFTTSIDANESLSNIHKFQYLKGFLKGDAANLIRHLALTEANYLEAWTKLVKRYDKKKRTVKELIELFLNQSSDISGSVKVLRSICDVSDEVLRGLKALGKEWETREPWLIHLVLKKVDTETQQLWAQHSNNIDCPSVTELLEFLTNRCDALESCAITKRATQPRQNPIAKILTSTTAESTSGCPMCNKQHPLFRCFQFKKLKAIARKQFVYEKQLCQRCMSSNHSLETCGIKLICYHCGGNHNTLLHINETQIEGCSTENQPMSTYTATAQQSSINMTSASTINTDNISSINSENNQTRKNSYSKREQSSEISNSYSNFNATNRTSCSNTGLTFSPSRAILSTVLVKASITNGSSTIIRALLDSGSQSSLISESCVHRIGLKRVRASVIVNGLGAKRAGHTKGAVELNIYSRYDDTNSTRINALILPKLTTCLPSVNIDKSKWPILDTINLADPSFNVPGEIDIILGNDVFLDIMMPEKINIESHLFAQNTRFGWILGGQFQENHDNIISSFHVSVANNDLELQLLRRFWELEEMQPNVKLTEAEQQCENHYVKSTTRDCNGRYIVRLPFKESTDILGASLYCAAKRLTAMEKKFHKNQIFREKYEHFMEEYSNLGHMELIPTNEITTKHVYLPHHAVCKENSTTTKLRVVFDGSCKTASGVSLNDALLVGPTIQEELLSILLRFRRHNVVLSADIEKMYRQVKLHSDDCDFQRILWRSKLIKTVQHYRLNTVTYGTSSAPFLAIRTLHQLADDYKDKYPEAAAILKKDYYVDDMLTGCEDVLQAITIFNDMSKLLAEGGFKLRKWHSNSEELLNHIPIELRDTSNLELDDTASVKTLGLHWNPVRDTFTFKVSLDLDIKYTKRSLLSEASRIFDPLGWISPTTISIKLLFQQLWLRKIDWDDELPKDMQEKWLKLRTYLPELEQISIPRPLQAVNNINAQIHIFSDASELAYCAVAYLRTEKMGIFTTRLIAAKTRVAPIQQVSLPRLELCGAVLSCRLVKYIQRSLAINSCDVFAWTDSRIVLAWLSDHPRKWKCFVANRVSEIIETIPRKHWMYVPSRENPADLGSRGVVPSNLIQNELWWNGPNWLGKNNEQWPNDPGQSEKLLIDERKKNFEYFHVHIQIDICAALFENVSSLQKIYRILSYVYKYISLIKVKTRKQAEEKKQSPPDPGTSITLDELILAENLCIRWAQEESFLDEITSLKNNRQLPARSNLLSLTPFIDENGILRVGGRIQQASCSFDMKHPIILPRNHVLSRYIITYYHMKHLHPGATLLSTLIKQRFWIIGCRNMTRFAVAKCMTCFKYKQHSNQQLMGNLPKARVSSCRPFLSTGVDYAGPIYIKERTGRGPCKTKKGYIALFVCMSVKAVHIEVVSDMTSDTFIAALQRFVSRRGLPVEIFCDNGSNFVGSKRELDELFELCKSEKHFNLISQFLSSQRIKFSFNPASAPHFGGLWEANVKSAKQHLRRVAGTTPLTFEELTTLMMQIEAVLNSRPLCRISEDVSSFDVLTPGHFLIGEPLTAIPEPNLMHLNSSKLSKWQNIQNRVQGFWKTWSKDYLTSLNQRSKWQTTTKNLVIDQLVLIQSENIPKGTWLLGRILELHAGHDGCVRVATVKTTKGVIKRPIVKLIPVPVE